MTLEHNGKLAHRSAPLKRAAPTDPVSKCRKVLLATGVYTNTNQYEQPSQLPERKYGVSLVMIPALEAELTLNAQKASGQVWPCKYDGQPFSTASLAFSESWRERAES